MYEKKMMYQPTWEEVNTLKDQGLITAKENPEAGLFILNYTNEVQYNYLWTPALEAMRGLIIDKDCNVIERPFKKFFNHNEPRGQWPLDEDYDIFEKMDGSLGILYFYKNIPYITTKGSFFSDQAKKATDIYHTKYRDVNIDRNLTYLFEIISDVSHIIVNYNYEDLVLVDIIDKSTGKSVKNHNWNYPFLRPKYWGRNIPIEDIFAEEQKNREGVIYKSVQSDFRSKIKFEPYKYLHKIIAGLSTEKSILELMIEYGDINNFLVQNIRGSEVPDENFEFIKNIEEKIDKQVLEMTTEAYDFYCKVDLDQSRKNLAAAFSQYKYPFILWGFYEPHKKDVKQMCLNCIKKEMKNDAKTN